MGETAHLDAAINSIRLRAEEGWAGLGKQCEYLTSEIPLSRVFTKVQRKEIEKGARLRQSRRDIVAWVGSNVVPHEADLCARLRRLAVPEQEIYDIVQDAYLRISKLNSIAHIRNGRAYFFSTARTVLLDRIRRERIVRIDSMTEFECLMLADDDPGPERRVGARRELDRILRLIKALPEPCRQIFELRRMQGVPQKAIAERLGIPEHTVEAQAVRGLKLLLKAMADECRSADKAANSSRENENGQQLN